MRKAKAPMLQVYAVYGRGENEVRRYSVLAYTAKSAVKQIREWAYGICYSGQENDFDQVGTTTYTVEITHKSGAGEGMVVTDREIAETGKYIDLMHFVEKLLKD